MKVEEIFFGGVSYCLPSEEGNDMTENILPIVYFLLRHDLSINLFDNLIELLNCCKTMIGNQLHYTAPEIALMIDEMFEEVVIW